MIVAASWAAVLRRLALLLVAVPLILTGSFAHKAHAASFRPGPQDGGSIRPQGEAPIVVNAGIYILSIGQFNTALGTYVADFYLTFQCPVECKPKSFEFMNGRATSVDQIDDEPNYKSYRIQASLNTDPDLRSYPFDRHNLSIQFEDKNQSMEELVYFPDPALNGVDPDVIVAGWRLDRWEPTVVDHVYPQFDAVYSRFKFDVEIERGVLSSVFKAVLPALVIVVSGFLSLLLGPDKALQRLGINTSALIGAIMFHVNLTSQLPPVGYLTLADKYMIMNYVGLVGALAATVTLLAMSTGAKAEKTAARLHKYSARSIPVVWAVGQIAVFTVR